MTRLHLIGNAHIDPVWLWQWQEGFQEVLATFRSALDRMNEFDDFIFTASSAVFYQWVEQNDPQMFAEIQRRVAEGRWAIVGGWWIEPDCNIPCGESFVRQALYGQRYLKAKFGRIATIGYAIDSFGHNGMLPQILKKCGLDSYVFMRPGPHEKELPGHLFWWEADDGSRVLAFRILHRYLSQDDSLVQHIRECAQALVPPVTDLMCFYGVGNHGGGPTCKTLAAIRQLQADPNLPDLILSAPDRFFAEIRKQGLSLPVVHEELQHHASGCYAAHSGIKRWNRQAENLLLAAEKLSTLAEWATGQPFPADLDRAWKAVLFNQFHDIMAGTSLEAAYDDARNAFGEAQAIAGRALNGAIQSLAWNVHIEPEEGLRPLIVFNPNAWPSRFNVECESGNLHSRDILKDTEALLDTDDQPIACQPVQSHAVLPGRGRISFTVDLPSLGYKVLRMASRAEPVRFPSMHATQTVIENDVLRLEINPDTGCIHSLSDKAAQVQVLSQAARPVVVDDPSDTWSHGVFRFDHVIGEFSLKTIRLAEHGPVKSVVQVLSEYGASRLIQNFTLYTGLPYVDVFVTVDWREQCKLLKLRFPLDLDHARVTHEIPYGSIERRANGDEEPGQSWVDVTGIHASSGRVYGLSLINDGKYSLDVLGSDIGLTVLRSPIYAHHIPGAPHPDRTYSTIDQGLQRFTYRLLPHLGDWKAAGAVRRAAELNQPPVTLNATFHPHGTLPLQDSFVAAEPASIIVSVVKKAQDGQDVVLRCYETDHRPTQARIRLMGGRTIKAEFGPCEIKTLRVPRELALPVVETNMLEFVQ